MLKTNPVFSKFSSETIGFRVNLGKSSLTPSQVKEWLGFVINSREMIISLPLKY